MDLDFVVRGDDNKLVSVLGVLYDESNTAYQNLASRKQLINGKCIVPFDAIILNNALSQRKIVAEYKSVSKSFVVIYKGSVSQLPENPKHGCLCYMLADNNSGILIAPLQRVTFSGRTIYLRCVDGWAEARVVPFIVDSGGGSSSSDTQSGGATVDDSQIATDEEVDQLLDDIFG